MKKIIISLILFSLIFIPFAYACLPFLNYRSRTFFVFTEIQNEEARDKYFYDGTLYTSEEMRDKISSQEEKLSEHDFYEVGFFGGDYFAISCSIGNKTDCRNKLYNSLIELNDSKIIYVSEDDVNEILDVAKFNHITMKVPYYKIGNYESKEKIWISYYDSGCYSPRDVEVPSLIISGEIYLIRANILGLITLIILILSFIIISFIIIKNKKSIQLKKSKTKKKKKTN